MDFAEKRKAVRFDGEIPVQLKHGAGVTRDYSTDGIYFLTNQGLSVGEQIEIVMHLEHTGLTNTLRLCCLAEVMRVEPDSERLGVAVAFTSHLFEGAPYVAKA